MFFVPVTHIEFLDFLGKINSKKKCFQSCYNGVLVIFMLENVNTVAFISEFQNMGNHKCGKPRKQKEMVISTEFSVQLTDCRWLLRIWWRLWEFIAELGGNRKDIKSFWLALLLVCPCCSVYLCGLWVKITSLMFLSQTKDTKTPCVHMLCWQLLYIKLGNKEIIHIYVNPKQVLWSSWHLVANYYTV